MKVRLKRVLTCTRLRVNAFQFHEGPIKTSSEGSRACNLRCFNSMKVRLKHVPTLKMLLRMLFQFHEGPIKTMILSN